MKPLSEKYRVLVKYSIIATLTYIVYFLIMLAAGLADIPEFRFANYFLFFFVTYYSLYDLVKLRKYSLEYLEGMAYTCILGTFSFLMFAAFVMVFSMFSPFFMEIVGREVQSARLGIWGPAFIVWAEGMGITSVVSLIMMQYFQAFSSRRQMFLFYGKRLLEMERQEREDKAFA